MIGKLTADLGPLPIETLPPLNVSVAEVLVAVQNKNLITWPQPLRLDPKTKDHNQYCQFHKTNGHDTTNNY